ncbi:16S rRNA (uracil(1498)-N(3))-methyltransferase [Phreatobacter stygius]|uniref:Ribosomal RNA small subunit methyltransferase E n=1 Tax=Phreatobacter stygius TaxID=1940610 RepID=A0A4D7BJU2_9HYPH|nr:16S rRNA (uracil(1498)-N(3))-methyltransferase [Phreatobacter stygius]QCI69276.1 16S rRNA (uracil(1498)-N(3))-methyltransferase [Phreatobacter stygius]
MALYDFGATRLFVQGPLGPGTVIACDRDKTNYLVNVMRLADGAVLHVFDGVNGEWRARLRRAAKKAVELLVEDQVRPQTDASDLWLIFAPLKQARLDYMVQKAVEMGASRLVPVTTRYTQVGRLNLERVSANAIEAAEQCGVLSVTPCDDMKPLPTVLAALPADRLLVFCDEDAAIANPAEALQPFASAPQPLAVLIGPEGGFAPEERAMISKRPRTIALSLGPRILRADTAAVAALAVVQAVLGDWR